MRKVIRMEGMIIAGIALVSIGIWKLLSKKSQDLATPIGLLIGGVIMIFVGYTM